MTPTVQHNIAMYIGESLFVDFDFSEELHSGQTIVSATYTVESPLTLDSGTEAINSAGNTAQARFTMGALAANGSRYTIECIATCTNPIETRINYALVQAVLVPT